MIIDMKISNTVKGHREISDTVLLVRLYGKTININIIQTYAPTANSSEEGKEFYDPLVQ